MPPKLKVSKSDIITAALDFVRHHGEQALNARDLAAVLQCSTQPIFSNFSTMEQLRLAVRDAADKLYQSYLQTDMASGQYPPYKASGMAYIRFAREERELFKLLFMCDRSHETIEEDMEPFRPMLNLLQDQLRISEQEAFRFHLEMWLYVHGIATMIATSYLNWDEAMVSQFLSDAYSGMRQHYLEGNHDCH